METSTNSITVRVGKTGKTAQPLLPEIELFIHLLILLQIFDNSDINKVFIIVLIIIISISDK